MNENKTAATNKREVARTVIFSTLINAVIPLVAYNFLSSQMGEVAALTLASLIPALGNMVTFARQRRFDVFGLFMLAGFVLSIGVVLLGGSPKFILVKESFLTGASGLVMLASLLFPRPILFYFASHFTAGNDPQARANFAAQWSHPYFRFVMYLMTIVWGLALVGEAIIRTILVFALDSTTLFLAVSPFVQYGIMGAGVAWTIWYKGHARRRGQQLRQQTQVLQSQLVAM